jgi:hypothetical protein
MIVATALILSACERASKEQSAQSASSKPAWTRVDLNALTTAQSAQVQRAIEARDALAQTLKGELMSAIQADGPVHAIDVCHTRAPEIAEEVADQFRLEIGRTSHKLRNSKNTEPVWMGDVLGEKLVATHAFADETGSLGIAYPIMLENACVICHGNDDQVSAPVREAITQRYPDDQATGFAPGDLRGWFWIQIPPES